MIVLWVWILSSVFDLGSDGEWSNAEFLAVLVTTGIVGFIGHLLLDK